MDLASLRGCAFSAIYGVFGISMTVTPVNGSPANVTGIWMTPTPTDLPLPDLRRRDRQRVIAFRRSEVPSLPSGSIVNAVEPGASAASDWRVDGFELTDAEQVRATVVPSA